MNPVDLFHERLSKERAAALAQIPALRKSLREHRCIFGEREIVRVLRPKFLSRADYADLDYLGGVLAGACRRFVDAAVTDRKLCDFLGLREEERRLLEPTPLCLDPMPFLRFDSFSCKDGFRFVELNAEAPAGGGFSDMASAALMTHPTVRAALTEIGATPFSARDSILDGLLLAWRTAGRTKKPRILITDYQDLPTVHEFHILRDHFEARGYEALIEDPRALSFDGSTLVAKGQNIDLVYRRVLVNEFLDRFDDVQELWRAYVQGAVVLVNPFRAKPAHKKSIFALLTGEVPTQVSFTREEESVIARTIPWTRRLRDTKTSYASSTIDLLPFIREHRERFAIKPNDEYGGKGVVLGWECDAATFDAALQGALAADSIVQERIVPTLELFPRLDDDLQLHPMIVDLDPYITFGRARGVLARLAAGSLCNVTSGGGQTPVFLYDER